MAERRGQNAPRRRAALAAALVACMASPASARAGERLDRVDGGRLRVWPRDLRYVPNFQLPEVVLYPPTATFGVILAALAATARIVRAGSGPLAYVRVVDQDGVRTEYHVSDEGKILSVRVRPSLFSPLDDDPNDR